MTGSFHPRELSGEIVRALESMPVVVLTGMRQVGKTTLLCQHEALRKRTFIDLEDFAQETTARSDPRRLLEVGPNVTIDEVQRAPDLLREIKRLVDQDRVNGRFLLSVSANLLLLSNVTESLAGRAVYLELGSMSRRELRRASEPPFLVSVLEDGEIDPDRDFEPLDRREVLVGGMPPVALEESERTIWLRGF